MITQAELVDELATVKPIKVRCPALKIDTERVIVEGDRGLMPAELPSYALERIETAKALQEDPERQEQGLLGKERNGRLVRWARGKELTYAVLRETFGSAERYDAVVEAMTVATADWMNICGVRLRHDVDGDTLTSLEEADSQVVFTVAEAEEASNLAALAFFPDDRDFGGPTERTIFVFDAWFAVQDVFDPTGVIRHELGHVLGFRHEHIRPEAPSVFAPESLAGTRELTEYDPKSVMHYLAPGVGDKKLRFTDQDRDGARLVYGGPDRDFHFVS